MASFQGIYTLRLLIDLMATAKPYHIYPGFATVAYPNRDSTPYKERYNIPEAQTIVRYI
jgi:saccharopine dehydrogenase (NADP+, L-glutamate forming)